MGSCGKFEYACCFSCNECTLPPCYPPDPFRTCIACVDRARAKRYYLRYFPLCKLQNCEFAAREVQEFVEGEIRADNRPYKKWYLWCVLLSTDSLFHSFTWSSNQEHGNISETEDILDRIMSFV